MEKLVLLKTTIENQNDMTMSEIVLHYLAVARTFDQDYRTLTLQHLFQILSLSGVETGKYSNLLLHFNDNLTIQKLFNELDN